MPCAGGRGGTDEEGRLGGRASPAAAPTTVANGVRVLGQGASFRANNEQITDISEQ